MALKIIHTKNLKWIDIVNPDDKDLLYLKENFKFHPLDFEDLVMPSIRVRIDEYSEYHFIVMLLPILNRESEEIKPVEVDFFVGKDYLITIHDGSMRTLTNLAHSVQQYDNVRAQYMQQGPGLLLSSLLELLFKRSSPILDKLNQDAAGAGRNIFSSDINTLEQLSRLKKNIIIARRIMKMHRYVLGKLARSKKDYLQFKDSSTYFQDLIEYAENIWEVLSADKESVESFEETNQSLAAHRMNDTLRTLTVFSVIIFILTLFINVLLFIESISKIANWEYLLPATLFSLAFITLVMLIYFKTRKWL
ncbi:MAG: hypothetical protein A3J07_03140 [Candidatus Doudnabacteria bacterium RIFCSPLOWO2_02_FULL_49_13]|uniref:Magnesium transporter CorA n=1 Tax=Candidatus Doudnabacteria bacterium RIFCSPHIGHO2_12_FULL_48_16 TaxID=1817838 RepID=A0A1F5PIC6_9BACT|nr:MAG: hypothetical protein A3B77_01945 [Candidatus Doudnabacteria bacterium RIFCSPHIGHO2_02_FULL_49_24]OGE89006.1 MAG: hypothetical protein A2760_00065 [Candidatus Doudnabacteria bacterium RIFCSPHIGHO2_01_FULL_50_67]OGE89703.1 MAG: hypothetical protein A3E29_00610 [Candidatus Doudnabacteria bacterium RIFCSPHIGHO2_12_FULL_48_16]OGE97537.1 MAG: hypothetical protein A2990_02350 [Candidatus Doudnabacteria bacterium RIFCSPLOWO2_01_FULL_49_40]OGF03059.1 MAG: hypothetical protein A3J07_03140 [Candid